MLSYKLVISFTTGTRFWNSHNKKQFSSVIALVLMFPTFGEKKTGKQKA
jgi:hypothetical protein